MTVIAWDGKTLAADKMASDPWTHCNRTRKIHRLRGLLVAGTGDCALLREKMAWFEAGAKVEEFPAAARANENTDLLVIGPQGRIRLYQNSPYPVEFEQPIFALGSGKEAALAVMMLGHDARKAVEIASAVSNGCGNGVDVLEAAP